MTPAPSAPARQLLYAAAIGAFAQLAQILLVRELLDSLRGGELLLGGIFAAHLLAGALGVLLASAWLPLRRGDGRDEGHSSRGTAKHGLEARATTILLPLLTAITLLVTLAFARIAGSTAMSPLYYSLLIAAALAVPAPLLCGLLFGRLLRGNSAAAIPFYQSDTWGAVLAGIAFSFMLSTAPSLLAAAIGGILLIMAAWLSVSDPWTRRQSLTTFAAIFLLLLASLLPLDSALDRYRWHRRLPDHDLREVRLTPHGRLAVLARRDQSQISFFRGPDLLGTLETPPPPDERALADVLACLVSNPGRIAIVGGSVSSLPQQFARHDPRSILLMETESGVLELAERYGSWPMKTRASSQDPRRVMWELDSDTYGLILIFPGHLDSLLANRLASAEFFHRLGLSLAPEGIFAVSLPTFGSGSEYLSPAVESRNRAVAAALSQSFPHVRAIPINGCLLVASCAPISLDPVTLAQRLATRPNAAPTIIVSGQPVPISQKDYFDSLFGGVLATQSSLDGPSRQEALARFEAHLQSNRDQPNSDTHPRALLASLSIGNELTGNRSFDLRGLDSPSLAIIPLLILIVIAAAFRFARTGAGMPMPTTFCALAAGFFAIAFEVAVLHLYQTRHGNLIHEIGWLLACFMAGLAIGARFGGRPTTRPGLRQRLLLLGMVFLCMAMVVLPIVFSPLMLLGGLCVGAFFALLVQQQPRHASRLYAADLIGSALGAILIGTFWLPIAGLAHCMAGLIALLLIAMLMPTCACRG